MSILNCSIVTPSKKIFEGEINYIDAPGKIGEFGVLPGHESFITTLDVGIINIKTESDTSETFLIVGGYFEIADDKIIVIADEVYSKEDIDKSEASKKVDELKNRLSSINIADKEYNSIKREYDKYTNMIKLAS